MRLFLSMALVMVSFAAFAAETKQDDKQPVPLKNEKNDDITIINGQKFYSLRNARRFSGLKKPMPQTGKREGHKPIIASHEQFPSAAPAETAASKAMADSANAHGSKTSEDIKLPQDLMAKSATVIIPPASTANKPGTAPSASNSKSPVLDIFAPEGN